jgi:hypothetical protein
MTGSKRHNVSNAMYDIMKGKQPIEFGVKPAIEKGITPKLKGLSEGDIRKKHDIKFILEQILSGLEKGSFIPDADFIKQSEIKSHVGYRQILDGNDYKRYKGRAGGIVYWSHPESIQKMKDESILS